uniref:Uncharacterized protein n=1 Tax=Oryza nivara TaxID=4536 RepID=A0A0E0GHU3_ORYNI
MSTPSAGPPLLPPSLPLAVSGADHQKSCGSKDGDYSDSLLFVDPRSTTDLLEVADWAKAWRHPKGNQGRGGDSSMWQERETAGVGVGDGCTGWPKTIDAAHRKAVGWLGGEITFGVGIYAGGGLKDSK